MAARKPAKKGTQVATIAELSQDLHAKKIPSRTIVDECLARIADLNPNLNAFITVLAEEARDQAQRADTEIRAGRWRGPLHGIPIGIKDFYDTANVRTTAAFERFKDRIPTRDAVSVAALKEAGAILIGKTNMHRLGMGTTGLDSAFGPVRNPWNDAYIPGGSSSGSAAAVASGMCYATLDTDAIGSCRLPAACCGVVGFKGTYGLISAKGILEGEKADEAIIWLSHPGIMTRSVADTAIVLHALAPTGAAATTSLRIGIATNFIAEDETRRAFEKAVADVRSLGHRIVRANAPLDIPRVGDLRTIAADRQSISDRAFRDVDVLLLPTLASTVLTVEEARANPQSLSPANTVFANYFGLPAISVPCAFDSRGLPIGLQIVGRPSEDATVLRLACEYEAVAGFDRMTPPGA
jgi:aspartyl-tRNA(Asn)/glutamyl-tRNA(Gln) amidotransferase subunit A